MKTTHRQFALALLVGISELQFKFMQLFFYLFKNLFGFSVSSTAVLFPVFGTPLVITGVLLNTAGTDLLPPFSFCLTVPSSTLPVPPISFLYVHHKYAGTWMSFHTEFNHFTWINKSIVSKQYANKKQSKRNSKVSSMVKYLQYTFNGLLLSGHCVPLKLIRYY